MFEEERCYVERPNYQNLAYVKTAKSSDINISSRGKVHINESGEIVKNLGTMDGL